MYPLRMEALQPLLKKPEAAKVLNICPRMVDLLVSRGELQCVKIGTAVRFALADVQAFIAAQRKEGK